jgi:hypothetical protein
MTMQKCWAWHYKGRKREELREISPLSVEFKSHPARYDLHPLPFEAWLSEGRTGAVTAESYAKRVRLLNKIASSCLAAKHT